VTSIDVKLSSTTSSIYLKIWFHQLDILEIAATSTPLDLNMLQA